jgi:hypothetical protein
VKRSILALKALKKMLPSSDCRWQISGIVELFRATECPVQFEWLTQIANEPKQ